MTKFKIDEISRIARKASQHGHFPLRGVDDLMEALGGRDASIEYEGKSRKASDASRIPNEVFPIETEEDLVATLASLRARGGDEAEGMRRGEELRELPPDAGQPREIPERERLPRGKVGSKGWR